jgi:F0F1-type ATP synthase assembly protein I
MLESLLTNTANDIDDCSNNMDESGDGCALSFSSGVIAGIVIGVVLAIVFIATFSFLIRRHRFRRSYTNIN